MACQGACVAPGADPWGGRQEPSAARLRCTGSVASSSCMTAISASLVSSLSSPSSSLHRGESMTGMSLNMYVICYTVTQKGPRFLVENMAPIKRQWALLVTMQLR